MADRSVYWFGLGAAGWVLAALVAAGCSGGGGSAADAGATADGGASVDAGSPADATDALGAGDGATAGADAADGETADGGAMADGGADGAAADGAAETDAGVPPGHWEQIQPDVVNKDHVFKDIWLDPASGDAFVVGADGVTLRLHAGEWKRVTQGEWPNLNAVWGAPGSTPWAVGLGGTLLRWTGSGWTEAGGCGEDANCDDGDPCTQDACVDGACTHEAVAAGPACCEGDDWSESFDGPGLGGWQSTDLYADDPTAGGTVWHVFGYTGPDGQPRYTSPPAALYFGRPDAPCPGDPASTCPRYGNDQDTPVGAVVTSPAFAVPQAASATLHFEYWNDTSGGLLSDVLSAGIVDADGSFTKVWTAPGTTFGFVPVDVDVSKWAGQVVRVAFSFDSKSGVGNYGEGVWIDDVSVTTTCGPLSQTGISLPTLFDVWGSGEEDVYAVGLDGTVVHWDGKSWSSSVLGASGHPWPLVALSGGADGGWMAVGGEGTALRWDGQAVDRVAAPVDVGLEGVWWVSEGEVWAVGGGGTVLRWDGSSWQTQSVPVNADLHAVGGAVAGQPVAVGGGGVIVRRGGGVWQQDDSPVTADLRAVWMASADAGWAVGDGGVIVSWDGTAWQEEPSPTSQDLVALWGVAPDDVWAAGKAGAIAHRDASGWQSVKSPAGADWFAVWADAEGDVVLTGTDGFTAVRTGGTRHEMKHPFAPVPIAALWGASLDDLWAVGEGFVLHYDGNDEYRWDVVATVMPKALTWRGICGTGPDDVYVVGQGAAIAHFDGANWRLVPVEPDPPPDEGSDPVPVTAKLYGCAARGEHVWAVGEEGTVLELDGNRFVRGSNPVPVSLRRVLAVRDDFIVAVGIEGVTLYATGPKMAWQPLPTGTVAGLFGLDATSLDDLYAVGDLGTLLHFVPNADFFDHGDAP